MKRPFTAIEMDNTFMDAVHEGVKLTVILGGHHDYMNGDKMLIVCKQDDFMPFRAVISAITHTTLGQVDESTRWSEMFDSVDALLAGMRRFYPYIEKNSKVTVIRWRKA